MSRTTSTPSFAATWRSIALLGLLLVAGCAHRLSAEQIAVLKSQGFTPSPDETWQLGLSDKMLFDLGSDKLKQATQEAIEHTGQSLNAVKIRNIRVVGHTDSSGPEALNMALSQRRAAVVADALSKTGPANPIGVIGRGPKEPVADNTTEQGRAENRRVAVIVPENQE